jgi:type VI protein secretion system component Hcp
MAEDKKGDLLMKFVQSNGDIVKGGATSQLSKDDKFLFDFWAGKFIEVEEFQLGLNLEDSEIGNTALNATSSQQAGAEVGGHTAKFASWRDYKKKTRDDVAKIGYPVVLQPCSFSHVMDRTSPILFQNCCNSISFDSATLVKRKHTGGTLALQSFLRIDFSNVLIIGLDWDDGQVVKEKCKFICRGLTVQYKQQASDGTLGAARSAEWKRELATRTSP